MLTFASLLPSETWTEQMASLLFWGGASIVSLGTIYAYGNDFVDKPKLVDDSNKDL